MAPSRPRITGDGLQKFGPTGQEYDSSDDDRADKRSRLGQTDQSPDPSPPRDNTSSPPSPCPGPSMDRNGRPPDEKDQTTLLVAFDRDDDPANPYQWSRSKKLFVVVASAILVMNSTIGSSIAAGGTRQTARHFHLDDDGGDQALAVLPTSIYLVGYVLGPFVFPPLSESFGRKPVLIATFAPFTAFTLGCALAPTYAGLVVFRLLVGVAASPPISVVGGVYADLYDTRKARGLAITLFMVATTWGPLIGPVASGFAAPVDWRWAYWIGLIVAGFTWPLLLLMPETFGPVILKRKARALRRATGDQRIVAPGELEQRDWRELAVRVLTRPVRMFLFETICLTTCLYLSVVYGIFYMFFQAFPIVFEGVYGFNAGEEGLTFLPIGIGAIVAGAVYLVWDNHLDRSLGKTPPPAWTQVEEYARLPLACLGGPLFVASLFWLGWTARPSIHWIVPTLSTLPFGTGFLLIFMGELNYLVDAYEIYAASAMGAASGARSLFGVVLPFAARPMYERLGIAWACSVLGFLSLVMACIPFFFIRYGDRIRAGSRFCQELRQQKEARGGEAMEERASSGSQVVSPCPDERQV